MKKQVRDKSRTEYISFRCTLKEKKLLETMADNADIFRSNMIQILIWEGAEKRKIHLKDDEAKL
jgi:hypothetical protein